MIATSKSYPLRQWAVLVSSKLYCLANVDIPTQLKFTMDYIINFSMTIIKQTILLFEANRKSQSHVVIVTILN